MKRIKGMPPNLRPSLRPRETELQSKITISKNLNEWKIISPMLFHDAESLLVVQISLDCKKVFVSSIVYLIKWLIEFDQTPNCKIHIIVLHCFGRQKVLFGRMRFKKKKAKLCPRHFHRKLQTQACQSLSPVVIINIIWVFVLFFSQKLRF